MCGFGRRKCRCGGIAPCCSASTTLIRPAMPAAASRWPMLVLTEPTTSGRRSRAPGRRRRPARAPRSGRRARCRCRGPRRSRRRAGRQPGVRERRADHRLLRGPLGTVRPLLRPSWLTAEPRITARTVAVGQRVGQPLQHDQAAPLAAHEAVGGRVERLAAPVGRQHARAASRSMLTSGVSIRLTPPASASVALAAAQALAGEVDRDQRRRARGVDGQARALQPEHVRQAAGRDAVGVAGADVGVDRARAPRPSSRLGVVAAADADEHAGARCPAGRRGRCRRAPAPPRPPPAAAAAAGPCATASRGEMPKNCGSNRRRSSRKPPCRVDDLARRVGVGIVEGVDVPAVRRDLADRVAARRSQQLPERLGVVGAAGEAAADADDRDRLGLHAVQVVQPGAQLSQRQQGAGEAIRGAREYPADPSSFGVIPRSHRPAQILTIPTLRRSCVQSRHPSIRQVGRNCPDLRGYGVPQAGHSLRADIGQSGRVGVIERHGARERAAESGCSRFLNSTDVSESIPSSKKPAGADRPGLVEPEARPPCRGRARPGSGAPLVGRSGVEASRNSGARPGGGAAETPANSANRGRRASRSATCDQSTATAATWAAAACHIRSSSRRPCSGAIAPPPWVRARSSAPRSAAAPTSAQAPQSMLIAGQPLAAAVAGQRVEERVGGRVIGLPRRADHGGRTRNRGRRNRGPCPASGRGGSRPPRPWAAGPGRTAPTRGAAGRRRRAPRLRGSPRATAAASPRRLSARGPPRRAGPRRPDTRPAAPPSVPTRGASAPCARRRRCGRPAPATAPRATSHRAVSRPRPPRPPVIR